MTILFNGIPSAWSVPGHYLEFDPSRANTGQMLKKAVLFGQRLSTGTVAANTLTVITRSGQGAQYFGAGSMLSHMCERALKTNPQIPLYVIAADDLTAGQYATGAYTLSNNASSGGLLRVYIASELHGLAVGFASGDTPAVVAAINAADLPVKAEIDGGNADNIIVTARHKGECGNTISLSVGIEGTSADSAPSVAVTPMSGGAGNPDLTDLLAVLGDDCFNWIGMPWTDAANLSILDDELDRRFDPMNQIGCRAFTAKHGTHAELLTFGNTRNNYHVTTMGAGSSPEPDYLWVATNVVAAANSLAIDPSRQLSTLKLMVEPPKPEMRFIAQERNQQLFDGISTYIVGSDGSVYIEAQITNYQENAQGMADDSVLYVNTPELFDAYRWEQQVLFAPYRRYKLMDDGNDLPEGQPIMTPNKAKLLFLGLYQRFISEFGWCENFEQYEASFLIEKQGNRLAYVDQPNFVENLRQLYGRSELVN